MTTRLSTLQKKLATDQACLLSQAGDITYFSSFHFLVPAEREALLLVTKTHAYLFHGRFCPVTKVDGVSTVVASTPSQVAQEIASIQQKFGFTTLLVDTHSLFVNEYEEFRTLTEVTLSPLDSTLIWQQRMIKDETEIKSCRQAATIAYQSLAALRKKIMIGVSERELQQELEYLMTRAGSEQPAFPTIVAFCDHTALPHHQPTDRKLKPNTPVLIDFGATIHGYRSDMTRSWWFGNQPNAEYVKIEQTVQLAYTTALDKLKTQAKTKTSVSAKAVDDMARTIITEADYGEYFIHTTGHGVGLDIHEPPSLSFRNETELKPGMVVTIEPGIYLEGKYGYRHENTVLVTEKDYLVLTQTKK